MHLRGFIEDREIGIYASMRVIIIASEELDACAIGKRAEQLGFIVIDARDPDRIIL